jgi:hypothetical protein
MMVKKKKGKERVGGSVCRVGLGLGGWEEEEEERQQDKQQQLQAPARQDPSDDPHTARATKTRRRTLKKEEKGTAQ